MFHKPSRPKTPMHDDAERILLELFGENESISAHTSPIAKNTPSAVLQALPQTNQEPLKSNLQEKITPIDPHVLFKTSPPLFVAPKRRVQRSAVYTVFSAIALLFLFIALAFISAMRTLPVKKNTSTSSVQPEPLEERTLDKGIKDIAVETTDPNRDTGNKTSPEPDTSQKFSNQTKKELRRLFFETYKNQDHPQALDIARHLETRFGLDWETEYIAAESAKKIGLRTEALGRLQQFIQKYPTNRYANKAAFSVACLLVDEGQIDAARPYFERLSKIPDKNLAKQSKTWLRKLGNPHEVN